MLDQPEAPQTILSYVKNNSDKVDVRKIQELLSQKNPNVNQQDADGKTALSILVARGGTFAPVRLLLKSGALFNIKDSQDQTALDYIAGTKQPQLLFLLVAAYRNQKTDLPQETLEKDPKISAIKSLFDFKFKTEERLGRIFKRLIDNYFDFGELNKPELEILEKIDESRIDHLLKAPLKRQKSDSSSDESESEKTAIRIDETFLDPFEAIGIEDNKITEELKSWFSNFSSEINKELKRKLDLEELKRSTAEELIITLKIAERALQKQSNDQKINIPIIQDIGYEIIKHLSEQELNDLNANLKALNPKPVVQKPSLGARTGPIKSPTF